MTPASGPEIVATDLGTPVLRLRLPDDVEWTISGGGDAATGDSLDPGYADISGRSTRYYPDFDLAYYAKGTAETVGSLGPEVERIADRTVAGSTASSWRGTTPPASPTSSAPSTATSRST